MKKLVMLICTLFISACQNNNSVELNFCAQQNYQCETQCERVAPKDSLSSQMCLGECTDNFNSCKQEAELLTKTSQTPE
jgi:hypothetical protein